MRVRCEAVQHGGVVLVQTLGPKSAIAAYRYSKTPLSPVRLLIAFAEPYSERFRLCGKVVEQVPRQFVRVDLGNRASP